MKSDNNSAAGHNLLVHLLEVAAGVGAYRQHEIAERRARHIWQLSSVDYAERIAVTDPERLPAIWPLVLAAPRRLAAGLMIVRRA